MKLLILLLGLIVSWGWFYIALSSGLSMATAALIWFVAAGIVAILAFS
jgi:hypothetical protein